MKHEAWASTRGHSHILKFHTDIWSDSNCTFDDNLALQFFFVCACACVIPIPLVLAYPL
jgi:hypothetical protein